MAKRRTHFHDFMLSVHSQLQQLRGRADPLAEVAREMRREVRVLCLDEFMVSCCGGIFPMLAWLAFCPEIQSLNQKS